MKKLNKELFEYIKAAPTAFQAVAESAKMLEKAGFAELKESETWEIKENGRYYVKRNGSSIIAFTIPADGYGPYRIVASHSDSPSFKIKEMAELTKAGVYASLNTEGYGGMILSTWFDRPLGIAGRIFVEACDGNGHCCQNCNGIVEKLVDFEKDMVMIPNLAIHMDRTVNDGYKYNKQIDMMPLWGMKSEASGFDKTTDQKVATLQAQVAKLAGVKPEEILGGDLFLYNRQAGTVWGANDEFISAPRLDDLACAFASLKAVTDEAVLAEHAKPAKESYAKGKINVCAIFDNEEVGSGTKQGADSTFLYDVLRRIAISMGASEEEFYCKLADSRMASADNAHAVHPNHPEKTDENNHCFINGGIVVKYNAAQHYSTDGASAAYMKKLCKSANIPMQVFANRSDVAGGSTLGNISGAHVSISTVDIGLPQLAMHSTYETMGAEDLKHMVEFMKTFYL